MDKKIIFFDIDGTLADEYTFEIPTSTILAMKQAQANGHLLFVNTGRGSCFVEESIRNLPLDGIIYGCGTEISYHHQTITFHQFSKDLRKRIISSSYKHHLENILEGNTAIYYPNKELIDPFVIHQRQHYIDQGFPVKTYHLNDDCMFQKMAAWYQDEEDIKAFMDEFKDELAFIDRHGFYEILPKAYNKATGIQELIDYLHIPLENTFAIGDSANDLTMLNYVHTSIAMGNSAKELFSVVDYVTTSLHDDGIYNALKHFHLI